MKITVHLFAVLRETAGTSRIDLEIPAPSTARQVAQLLAERFPKMRAHLPVLSFAVNGEIVPAETAVPEGGEVALLPPVSGG